MEDEDEDEEEAEEERVAEDWATRCFLPKRILTLQSGETKRTEKNQVPATQKVE
jgi:hypothetical protein